jgi:hypothetical protein
MIHEEICTYEVCKLAKEKGFNEYVEAFYAEGCDTAHSQGPEKWNEYKGRYAAPTQSLLQRWLREEKATAIVLQPYSYNIQQSIYTWVYEIWVDNNFEKTSKSFKTYELALEDALKYVLENFV